MIRETCNFCHIQSKSFGMLSITFSIYQIRYFTDIKQSNHVSYLAVAAFVTCRLGDLIEIDSDDQEL